MAILASPFPASWNINDFGVWLINFWLGSGGFLWKPVAQLRTDLWAEFICRMKVPFARSFVIRSGEVRVKACPKVVVSVY